MHIDINGTSKDWNMMMYNLLYNNRNMPTTTRYSVVIDATKDDNGKMTYATVSPPTKITGGPPIASMSGPPLGVMSGPPPGVMSPSGPPLVMPSSMPPSALLQAIKKGTMLKAPKASMRPPMTNERSALLSQLKEGATLKSATKRILPEIKKEKTNLEKAQEKITGRRKATKPETNGGYRYSNSNGNCGGSHRKKSHVTRRNRR